MSMMDESLKKGLADFREAAFQESSHILQSTTFDSEIAHDSQASSGLSICAGTNEDSASIHRRLRLLIGVHAAIGFLGIAIGGAMAFWRKHAGDEGNDWPWLGIAGVASLSGFIVLFRGSLQERKLLRSMVKARLGKTLDWKTAQPTYVHIEDAATRDRLKLLSEDAGILFLKPDVQRLHIEGISARYSIASEDVENVESYKVGKSRAVLMTVRIGQTLLTMSLKDQGIKSELNAQLLHRNSLFRKIQKTLGQT